MSETLEEFDSKGNGEGHNWFGSKSKSRDQVGEPSPPEPTSQFP
jgi:hypothetical protein